MNNWLAGLLTDCLGTDLLNGWHNSLVDLPNDWLHVYLAAFLF
jgi:hypothetical protein